MKKLALLLTLLPACLLAQTPAGIAFNPRASSYSSADVHVPTNYQTQASPTVGVVQTDPDFGAQYWKVADNSVHEYSAMAVIDTNDRWIVTIPTVSGGVTTPAVIRDLHTGAAVCTVTGVGQGLRWGINDPNVLWYANNNTNHLQVYYVTAHTGPAGAQSACTMVDYDNLSATFTNLSNCFGESDVASLAGHDMLCLSNDANHDSDGASVRRYDTTTKTLGAALSAGSSYYFGTQCNDYADVTYVNGYLLITYNGLTVASGCTTRDTNTAHQYGGVDIFNGSTGAFVRTVQNWGCGHGSRLILPDGSEGIACNDNSFNATPACTGGNGIQTTRLSDSAQTCLVNYAHNLPPFTPGTPDVRREQLTSVHNVSGAHHNLLVSYIDATGEAGTPTPPLCTAYRGPNNDTTLVSDCASTWGVMMNELFSVPLDGTSNAYHLVHHHSFWVGSGGVQYWSGVHGSVSRSGNYAAFDSAFLNTWPNLGVFVVALNTSTTTPISTHKGGHRKGGIRK